MSLYGMQYIHVLLDHLEKREPFSFAKFNDGEIEIIQDKNRLVSRGYQRGNQELSDKLKEALLHRQTNYYPGIPCTHCRSHLYDFACQLLNNDLTNIMSACVMINSNSKITLETFRRLLPTRRIVMVMSENAANNIDRLKDYGITPYQVITVPFNDAWSKYGEMREGYNKCQNGDVVLFCCGPLGRVLCYDWFKANPTLTCIEIGSFYDPVLVERCYLYHDDAIQLCEGCNIKHMGQSIFPKNVIRKCYHREQYLFEEWDTMKAIYKGDYQGMHNNYSIIFECCHDEDIKFYSRWMMARCQRELHNDIDITQKEYAIVYLLYPNRAEPMFELAVSMPDSYLKTKYAVIASQIALPTSGRWINMNIYQWEALDYVSIHAYYTSLKDTEGKKAFTKLVTERRKFIPDYVWGRVKTNGIFYGFELHLEEKTVEKQMEESGIVEIIRKIDNKQKQRKIHTLGDSHASGGWVRVNLPNWQVEFHNLGPKLMYSVGRDGLEILDITKPEYQINDGDVCIFSFGEIDCRCHIDKYKEHGYQQVIDNIVDKYFQILELNRNRWQTIYPDKEVRLGVLSITPACRKDQRKYYNEQLPHLGTDEERNQYIQYMNKKLKEKSQEHKYIFVDVWKSYVDEEGFLIRELSDGDIHIEDPKYLEEFVRTNI
jgi:hypothetical protein